MTEPRKTRKAFWFELPPAEMAAHLLATPTIPDGVWTSEPRLPGEARADFVRRVLLSETLESEPETPQVEAAALAGPNHRYYLLNTDGGNSGDPLGRAAIAALLRTRRLVTVAQISKAIGPATHNVAEYHSLIEGLRLARDHGVQHIRVYMDSELVVDQVNGVSAVRQAHLIELHELATGLVALFKSIRISWVPREMNAEADRLVNDALRAAPVSVAGGVRDPTDSRPHIARTSASADAVAGTPALPARPSFRELPADVLCAYLLATPTIPDTAWIARFGSPARLPGESRSAFIRRVLS